MRRLTVLAVYVAAAVILTWPLAMHLTDRLGAPQGPGDPFLNLWILGWGLRAWTTDPAGVIAGRVFDANIFHPAEGTLAYSDHGLLQALVLVPAYLVTGDVTLCYNLVLLGSIVASGLAMHALTNAVTGSTAAAYAAGLAWACWPYRTAHLLHLQLQALYFMPLALLCVHKLVAKRRWRDSFALGAVTALQAIASVYYGVMTAVAIGVASVTLAVSTGLWRNARLWTRMIAAAAVALVLSLPVLIPYLRSQQAEGFGRTLYEAGNHSAAWQSYTQVPPENLLYGRTGLLAPRPPRAGERDRRSAEHQMFPGVVLLVLAVAGLVRNWRSAARPLVMSALALAVSGIVLSMGPEGVRALYAVLHDNVFGFQAIRAPARFAVVAMLGVGLLAALGMRVIVRSFNSRSGGPSGPPSLAGLKPRHYVPIFVVSGMLLEYLNAPLPLAAAPPRTTAAGQWLKQEPTQGAVVYLPLSHDLENTPVMVQSLEHGRPIVNGYSGQRPAFYSALVDSLADLPSPSAFAALREIDVRFVVAPSALAGAGSPASPLVERARFADRVIYELRWTPESLATLDERSAPPPPDPGEAPFEAGETAVYEVYWDGGPIDLAAGRATLAVLRGRSGGIWEFEASADTADWVSSFFEARDRFRTIADATLHPLEHVREIREGRRSLDRTYLYDRDARVIRIGETRKDAQDPGALALPLGDPAARDALTALYYVRTLPLSPASILTVPINEAGSSLVLQVTVGEREQLTLSGRSVDALRLEPRLMRRIERRRPIAMTLWLSEDERRVPLRVLVDAGFGRVRAELVDYRR